MLEKTSWKYRTPAKPGVIEGNADRGRCVRNAADGRDLRLSERATVDLSFGNVTPAFVPAVDNTVEGKGDGRLGIGLPRGVFAWFRPGGVEKKGKACGD